MAKVILCPIRSNLKDSPGNLLFAANYLSDVAKKEFGEDVKVVYLYYPQNGYGNWVTLKLNFWIAYKAFQIKHDIVYYGADPVNLALLAFLKNIGVYRKQMYAWKYIALYRSKNSFVAWLKKRFYAAFDCTFMITERHVDESIAYGMTNSRKCKYIEWGEDIDYVTKITPPHVHSSQDDGLMTFISTGKAFRDMETLCKAFMGLKARLKIFAPMKWGSENYEEVLSQFKFPNIEICFVEKLDLKGYKSVLDYIYAELKAADCSMVICKHVNFGVGFTAVLDAMVCQTAIVATYHKDNPIDIDKMGIGVTVPAEDVDALREKLQWLIDNRNSVEAFGNRGYDLIRERYNIRRVAHQVLSVMLDNDKNK